ncbi:hypothetical protein [Sphingobacterium paucimobilis]|uniref:Uncharacterized protein n=1 Tax=Sphingobacterium paucimobilis HER1398 TaxID=1346330 RepID=U2HWJ6_9SPHI|nr:hypothetical protein [Sphingobacterium paucimobilis]ERJ59917.1 hypothetical protein M472_14200 [Sphingobacterium paucimobilis HER1398]
MFRSIRYLTFITVFFSCGAKHEEKNIQWYHAQVIEQLEPQGDSVYRVQIGIMASSFWLTTDTKHFSKHLSLLENSLTNRKALDIGVENGSNKIILIKK